MVFMLGFVAEVGIDAGTDRGGAVYVFMLCNDVSLQSSANEARKRPYELGGNLLTGESEKLDRMTLLLKVLAKALALGGFAGAVETFDNN